MIYMLVGNGSRHGGNIKMAIIRIVRDVDFGGVVRIPAGAVRLVTADDLVGAALFVPCDLANDAAGVIALDPDDYEALEAPVPFDVAIQAF